MIVRGCVLKSRFIGTQDAIQFLDKPQELLSILFHGNQRTEFVNAVAVRLLHDEAAVSQHGASSVCSTSHSAEGRFGHLGGNERSARIVPGAGRLQVTDDGECYGDLSPIETTA